MLIVVFWIELAENKRPASPGLLFERETILKIVKREKRKEKMALTQM